MQWDLPVDYIVCTILDRGVEHHLAIVYGEHRDALVALAAEWGIPVIRLGEDRAAAQVSSIQSG